MYRCSDCEKEFEIVENNPCDSGEYHGIPYVTTKEMCPYCGSEYYSKVMHRCDICESPIIEGDTMFKIADGSILCERCVEVIEV